METADKYLTEKTAEEWGEQLSRNKPAVDLAKKLSRLGDELLSQVKRAEKLKIPTIRLKNAHKEIMDTVFNIGMKHYK